MRWAVFILIPFVFSLIVTKYPIRNLVKLGDYAEYNVTLFNDENKSVNVKIYGPYIEEKRLILGPNEKKSVVIRVKCLANIDYTHYIFVSYDSREIRIPLKIYALSLKELPETKCFVSFYQEKNELNFIINCSKKIISSCISIDGITKCGKNFIKIGGLPPKRYTAKITIHLEGEVIKKDINIEVLKMINVLKRIEKKDYFFFTTYKIVVENYGNSYYYEILKMNKKGIPLGKYEVRKNTVIIPIAVPPGEVRVYKIKFLKNLVLLIVPLIIVGAVGVYKYMPPVIVSKDYFYYSKDGRTLLHVVIKIKGLKNCTQLRIIDKVPKFGRIVRFETIMPEFEGNNLTWQIPRVKRGEVFYLNYTIEFDFEIVSGNIELPPLEVMYDGKRMKINAKKLEE